MAETNAKLISLPQSVVSMPDTEGLDTADVVEAHINHWEQAMATWEKAGIEDYRNECRVAAVALRLALRAIC